MAVIGHIELQEKEIADRIAFKINDPTNIDVEVLPDGLDAYRRPFKKGRISVSFDMSKYGDVDDLSFIKQDDTMHFCIILQCRKRRDTYGLYDLFNKAKLSIIGFRPTNCAKIYGVSFDFVDRQEDVWLYEFKIACKNMMVEDYNDDVLNLAPEFNSINFENTQDPEN